LLNTVTGKPIDGLGVIDYHCSWAIMHMLSMNGAPMLSVAEADAMRDLLLYTQGQFGARADVPERPTHGRVGSARRARPI
jgi:hypothetical protein